MILWLFLALSVSMGRSQMPLVTLAENPTYIFRRVSEMTDHLGTVGVVFDSPARSFLHCSALCAQTCCQRFTYSVETGTKRCRGYSRHNNSATVASVGARTYAWDGDVRGVPRNAALGKPANQSSVYIESIAYSADLAVDGSTKADTYFDQSCAHTLVEKTTGSWWQVDLESQYLVYTVLITNRGDCCGDRLRDFTVRVYNEDPSVDTLAVAILCHNYTGPMGTGVTEELPCCRPITGRFLRVTNTPGQLLTLCEVQVMAVPVI